ncbi:hypothetical protein GCM10027569_75900 [Flindersiella endophytica]
MHRVAADVARPLDDGVHGGHGISGGRDRALRTVFDQDGEHAQEVETGGLRQELPPRTFHPPAAVVEDRRRNRRAHRLVRWRHMKEQRPVADGLVWDLTHDGRSCAAAALWRLDKRIQKCGTILGVIDTDPELTA